MLEGIDRDNYKGVNVSSAGCIVVGHTILPSNGLYDFAAWFLTQDWVLLLSKCFVVGKDQGIQLLTHG